MMTSGSATRPTAWYVALYTAAPSDSGGGTEVSTGGYARQSVTFDAATSPGGTTSNSADVSFTAVGGNYGTVTHMGIFDASTGGNLLWHGVLSASKTVEDGDTITFSAGNIDLTMA
jgi:hypothetical protein